MKLHVRIVEIFVILLLSSVLLIPVFLITKGNHNHAAEPEEIISEVAPFSETDMEGMKQLMDEKASFVIILHRDSCSYCAAIVPIFEEYVKDNSFPSYHLNLSSSIDVYGQDAVVAFVNSYLIDAQHEDPEVGDVTLFIPDIIVVKDGKIIHDYLVDDGDVINHLDDALKKIMLTHFEECFEMIGIKANE